MAQITSLPSPDKDEIDSVLKEQKNAMKTGARREFLEKRDILLQRNYSNATKNRKGWAES